MYNGAMYISHGKKLKMNKHNSVYNNILVVNVKNIKIEDSLDKQVEDKKMTSNMVAGTGVGVAEQAQTQVHEQTAVYEPSVQQTDVEALVHVQENPDVHNQQNPITSEIDIEPKPAQSNSHYEMANIQASLIVSGKIVASFDETIKHVDEDGNIVTDSDIPSIFAQLERWIGIMSRTHGSIGSWASWDFYTQKALESAAQEHNKYLSFLKKKHIIVKEYFDDKYIVNKPTRKNNFKEQKPTQNNEFKGFATVKKALGFLKCKLDKKGVMSNDIANILLRGRFNLNRPVVKVKQHKGRHNKQRYNHSLNQSKK